MRATMEQEKQPESAWSLAKQEILSDPTLSDPERIILTHSTIDKVIDDIKVLDQDHADNSKSRRVMKFLEPVLTGLEKYGPAMDVLSQADPQGILTLTWGSIRLLLAVAKGFNRYFDELVEFLGDIARPMARLEIYGKLVPESQRLQVCLRAVFVDFLRFMNKTRRMFVDKTNKEHKLFRRPGATVFRKNVWQDYGKEVAQQIAHITKLCKDAEDEAQLAVSQTTIENQTTFEANAADARVKVEGAFDRQDEASRTIINNQFIQVQATFAESTLAHRERGMQEKERQAQGEERSRAGDEAERAQLERDLQEEERVAQREERAAAAAERQRIALENVETQKSAEAVLFKEVVDWLNPVDAMELFRQFREQRLQSTCDWILNNPACSKWIEKPIQNDVPHILWIHAIPGAGKTYICTRIVEYLQEISKSVAVFYCDTKDDRKRKTENILRSWSWQLLLHSPQKLRNVAELYRSGKQASVALFTEAVGAFLDGDEERYLVLDALDECESPTRILILKILAEFKTAKILITSREENDISIAMRRFGSAVATIKIETNDNAQDIQYYLQQKIEELSLDDKDLDYRIAEELFDAAEGMFLYARLMIGELLEKDTPEEIEEALNDLPKGLDTIYGRILSRIDGFPRETKKQNARLLLKFICAAQEPLSLDQIRDITAFNLDSDEDMLNPRRRLRSAEEFIYECCGPLVEISTHDHKVRISHASVKEYLVSRSRTGDATYFVDINEAHHILARSCLAYLSYTNIDVVDVGSDHDEALSKLEAHLKNIPMLQYATIYWWRHTLDRAKPMDKSLQRAFRKFATSNRHGVKWLQLFQYMRGDRTNLWHPGGNEYVEVLPLLVDLNKAWKKVANERTWLDELGMGEKYMRFYALLTCYSMHYYPAITIAALFNYPDVVEDELNRGINIETANWLGETAIMLGARGNSVQTVEVLIKRGANPSHIGDQTENALHRAISWAGLVGSVNQIRYDTVPLLLEAGADIHMRNFAGDTITHYIVGADYELASRIELLGWVLDAGGTDDLETKNNRGQTPLVMAAGAGHKGIVQALLDAGADPNGSMPPDTKYFHTPLLGAAKKEDPTIGLMLIDAGARVDIPEPANHYTPLIEAVIRGSRLVEALIHAGADPNVPDRNGTYPIHHAAIEDSTKVIPILLKNGAKIDEKDADGKTALDLAVEHGRAASVKILTEAGAIRAIADAPQSTSVETVGIVYPQSERDTMDMYALLRKQTKGQIHHARLVHILNTAEYWIKTTVERDDYTIVQHDDEDGPNGFLPYIISLPLTGANQHPVQKLIISTRSHDQGWSSTPQHKKTYDHSWTGFRLRVRRTPASAQEWEAHLKHEGNSDKRIHELMTLEEHHVQSNRHAWSEEKLHVNQWSRNGNYKELIRSLQKGDILEIVPWALYPGWENHILAVKLEIYTACFT